MYLQVTCLSKALVTLDALEWLLPCMGPCVDLQGTEFYKSFTTDWALVGSFPCVTLFMSLQVWQPCEGFITLRTCERLFCCERWKIFTGLLHELDDHWLLMITGHLDTFYYQRILYWLIYFGQNLRCKQGWDERPKPKVSTLGLIKIRKIQTAVFIESL